MEHASIKYMKKNIENYVIHYKNFLDEKFCDKCIQILDEEPERQESYDVTTAVARPTIIGWSRHNWYNHTSDDYHDNKEAHEGDSVEPWVILRQNYSKNIDKMNKNIIEKLYTKIQEYFDDIIEEVATKPTVWRGYSPLKFIKYDKGATMKKHWDNVSDLMNNKGIPILSIIGVFNDNYEGGDLNLCGDKKIDTKKGDLVIFPSSFLYPHEICKVTKGSRYSYVSWVW